MERKKEMDLYFQERAREGFVFDFQDEIRKYCYADVALLAASMVKFETSFEEVADIVAFDESTTAASAAALTFRRNCISEKRPIVLDTLKSKRIKHSRVSQLYLMWRQRSESKPIIMASNGGEHRVR